MKNDKFIINRVNIDDIITDINKVVNIVYQYRNNERKIIVLVAERYYVRIGCLLTATIIIEHINENQYQIITIIAGQDPSLGAESSMLKRIKNLFLNYIETS